MAAKLTDKQERFCHEYLIDLNATQATLRAGYKDQKSAAKVMRNPGVQARIAELQAGRSKRTAITADRVLEELALIGFADLADFVEWDTGRVTLKNSETLDAAKRRAIIEVAQARDGSVKIKLADKKGSLDSIGRHLGMFIDRHLVHVDEVENLSDEELANRLRECEQALAESAALPPTAGTGETS